MEHAPRFSLAGWLLPLSMAWLMIGPVTAQQQAEKPPEQESRLSTPATQLARPALQVRPAAIREGVLSDTAYRRILEAHVARTGERAVGPTATAVTRLDYPTQNSEFRGQYDCNDDDASVFPGATEVCDGVDNDCDGDVDKGLTSTYYLDADGDGWGDGSRTLLACSRPDGYAARANDCNDRNRQVFPGAHDIAGNDIDENCDGEDGP